MELGLEAQNIYNSFILDSCRIWKLPLEEQQKLIHQMCTYVGNHINYAIDNEHHKVERFEEEYIDLNVEKINLNQEK